MPIEFLPEKGIIRLSDLALFYEVNVQTLMKSLRKQGIPILKMGSMHRQQSVRLEDLKVVHNGGKP